MRRIGRTPTDPAPGPGEAPRPAPGNEPQPETPEWSFIIPCLNEDDFLPTTLHELDRHVPEGVRYEIVVVDHGSTDRTADIARRHGAHVVVAPHVSLGALRNRGAQAARGKVLIYLDADISLTPKWRKHIVAAVASLSDEPTGAVMTGSMPLPAPSSSWAGRYWESGRRVGGPVSMLGGGHMIMRRDRFFRIGGFPDDVDAGEDEELCARARRSGGSVLAHPELEVVHRGAPGSLSAFIHRQFWHGLGDAKNLARLLRSPMALVSGLFLLLHGLLPILLLGGGAARILFAPAAASILAIPATAALRRLGTLEDRRFPPLLILYWLCFLARGAAIAVRPFGVQRRRRRPAPAPGS